MPFRSTLEMRYAGVGRYEVTHPLLYEGAADWITVEPGFLTDLASVPRLVRWLLPQDGKYTQAAVLHDWLCRQLANWHVYLQSPVGWAEQNEVDGVAVIREPISSREVDGLFRRCCREAGTPLLARWLLWVGVRWSALKDPWRRADWHREALAVVALSVLAAPLVVPASLVVLAALVVYAVAETVVSGLDRLIRPDEEEES